MKVWSLLPILSLLLFGCASDPGLAPVEKYSHYSQPMASPGTKFWAMPPTAQKTVRAQAGGAPIEDITKVASSPMEIWEVRFVASRAYPPLYVSADGSVLSRDFTILIPGSDAVGGNESNVALADLPEEVKKTLATRAPAAKIAKIDKEAWGSAMMYIVTFAEGSNQAKLYIGAGGTLLNPGAASSK